jgi:peptidoglycan/xylan/chitin deacetylase (PgdA/CDA1 family)
MVLNRLRKLNKEAKIFFKVRRKTLVLMYHRIIEGPMDPWQLCVSPKNFEEHLKYLKSTGLVLSLDQFKKNMYSGEKLPPSILITFDDGYLDNYLYAKPLLEKYNLPATFFICSKHIGTKKEFWWDELAHLILETEILPQIFNLQLKGEKLHFDLKNDAVVSQELITQNRAWSWQMPATNSRIDLYLKIWEILSPLNYDEQQLMMEQIRASAGISAYAKKENYCMSEAQLLELSSNPLFTIGGHTQSHPMLTAFQRHVQIEEIKTNKEYLKAFTKQEINTFAYPSGKHDEVTVEVVKDLGFDLGFTTISKEVEKGGDKLRIPRRQALNLEKNRFRLAVGKWLL